ncbi:MAG TPA: TIGR03619 family F420-dependent LLM class oxidoreductase [Chloroflexota bacterium]|nr:TIGR03619 family F420-dependent LLM class oxidoreductase [Chloroflexota bacterium]
MRLAVVPIPSTRPAGALFDSRNLPALLDFARVAEDLGVDDLAMSEHVVMAHRPEKYGPGSAPHRFDEPWPEPLTTLAAMAAVTRRVRVISTIVIAPLRPAVLLAKTAATVHALSAGRFVLGVSTSWHEEEYAALGVPFAERGARLDDTLGACRALWGSTPASFTSRSVSFSELICVPRPERADDIPIWFGAAFTPRMVRRVVQYGHGWMPFVGSEPRPMEMMANGVAALRQAMVQAGRDPSTLEVSALLLPRGRDLHTAIAQDVPAFQSAGVTHLRVQTSMFAASLDEFPTVIETLLRHLEPYR